MLAIETPQWNVNGPAIPGTMNAPLMPGMAIPLHGRVRSALYGVRDDGVRFVVDIPARILAAPSPPIRLSELR